MSTGLFQDEGSDQVHSIMLCSTISLFLFFILQSCGVSLLSSLFVNDVPLLNPLDDARILTTEEAVLGNQATGIGTFLQVTDVHMGETYKDREEWEFFLSEIVEDLIKPGKVIVTGDLVHNMAANHQTTMLIDSEWEDYFSPLSVRGWDDCSFWVDQRGNHDSVGVVLPFGSEDRFVNYSSCGHLKSHVYTSTLRIPSDSLMKDDYSEDAHFDFVVIDDILEPSLTHPFGTFSGYPQSGIGELGTQQMQDAIASELEKLKAKKSGGVFLMTHTSTMYMNDPLRSDLIELLSTDVDKYPSVIALLNGHQHATFDRHFVNSEKGTLGGSELNSVDFGSSRGFRLFTVDHGMVGWDDFFWSSSTDASTDEVSYSPRTLVSVLNPPSSEQMTSRSGWSLVQNSTHLRVLIFSKEVPNDAFVVILEGKVSNADALVQTAYANTSILQNSRSSGTASQKSNSDALSTAQFFDLHRATGPNPNHIPLFVSEWDPSNFTAVEQYTLVVVVNTSNCSSEPVHVSTPRFFSVQGYTQLPYRPLLQLGANLDIAGISRHVIVAGEIILFSVLVLSWMMPCFGCCLSRTRFGNDTNQESSSTGSDRKTRSSLATLCQNSFNAINETVSNPTPLLSDEDFNSRDDISRHCSPLLRFVSIWHLDRLVPFIANLLPFGIVVQLDRMRRKAEALRMLKKMRRAEKAGGKEVWDGAESEEESMRRLQLLSSNPHTPSLSFPSHSYATRIIQTLVQLVYPYSHLPPLAHLCIAVVCIVLHTQPIIFGKPPDPQLSVRVYFNRNEQGGVSHDAFDTGQALWLLFVFGYCVPLLFVCGHVWSGRGERKGGKEKGKEMTELEKDEELQSTVICVEQSIALSDPFSATIAMSSESPLKLEPTLPPPPQPLPTLPSLTKQADSTIFSRIDATPATPSQSLNCPHPISSHPPPVPLTVMYYPTPPNTHSSTPLTLEPSSPPSQTAGIHLPPPSTPQPTSFHSEIQPQTTTHTKPDPKGSSWLTFCLTLIFGPNRLVPPHKTRSTAPAPILAPCSILPIVVCGVNLVVLSPLGDGFVWSPIVLPALIAAVLLLFCAVCSFVRSKQRICT
ncbi:hypothetical protein BLNAU_3835 [Blattamonas nauphoetae]|uniref:Calcineurin-like phosphoesterase domain-containing protein n=1 Tax=Blattamonas nauphoetae TaxID=2049346 RepID=A0ABQ9YBB8_9EUKA|nr:hypothetical protein BLNAU_3835 [Blattamonas nauphoetae]